MAGAGEETGARVGAYSAPPLLCAPRRYGHVVCECPACCVLRAVRRRRVCVRHLPFPGLPSALRWRCRVEACSAASPPLRSTTPRPQHFVFNAPAQHTHREDTSNTPCCLPTLGTPRASLSMRPPPSPPTPRWSFPTRGGWHVWRHAFGRRRRRWPRHNNGKGFVCAGAVRDVGKWA